METEKNWGADPLRAPDLKAGDEVIFSEHGRVLFNSCYRSYYHQLVKRDMCTVLLTKHGAGQEEYSDNLLDRIVPALRVLESDQRYILLHQIWDAYRDGRLQGREATAETYRKAFVDGRLKKRKMPNRAAVKVWIEPEPLRIGSVMSK